MEAELLAGLPCMSHQAQLVFTTAVFAVITTKRSGLGNPIGTGRRKLFKIVPIILFTPKSSNSTEIRSKKPKNLGSELKISGSG